MQIRMRPETITRQAAARKKWMEENRMDLPRRLREAADRQTNQTMKELYEELAAEADAHNPKETRS